MALSPVLVERRPPAALVKLNRPKKYNALNIELLERLRAIVEELGRDDEVRVVILSGSTKYFSTGMDLDDLATVTSVADTHRHLELFRDTNAALERCPKPVIAAISGYCLTGGLELALACDIRVAAKNATFGITSARIGSVAGAGVTQRLPRLVGPGRAKKLLFSADFIDVGPLDDGRQPLEAETRRMAHRYLGAEWGERYMRHTAADRAKDVLVRVRPERWLTASPEAAYITGQVLSVNGGIARLG